MLTANGVVLNSLKCHHGGTMLHHIFAMLAPRFHGRPYLFLDSVQKHGTSMVAKIAEWDLQLS
jgi:hypothetical protein